MKTVTAAITILVTGFFLLFQAGFCSGIPGPGDGKKDYPSFYTTTLRVDGNPSEWPSKLFFNNNETKVLYAVANDSNHLFFCLEMLDLPVQMSILHEGIDIWIDPAGKKRKTCSIHISARPLSQGNRSTPPGGEYPSAIPPRETNDRGANSRGHQRMNPKQKTTQFTCEMKTGGFRESFNGIAAMSENNNGFQAVIAYDAEGALVIEGSIPLQAFIVNPIQAKCLSLGFEIEQNSSGPEGGGQQGGMHGEGPQGGMQGGDRPGSGMPGSGQGGGNEMGGGSSMGGGNAGEGGGRGGPHEKNDSQNQSILIKIWHKFSIAR
ncbi:MAG: hypothetical protein NT040_16980 [Bacteroidetes bacterium]|nr:hypothetical protein [Bacteroidota bacterium]